MGCTGSPMRLKARSIRSRSFIRGEPFFQIRELIPKTFYAYSTSVPKSINTVRKLPQCAGDPDSELWSPASAPERTRIPRRRAPAVRVRVTSAPSWRNLSWIYGSTASAPWRRRFSSSLSRSSARALSQGTSWGRPLSLRENKCKTWKAFAEDASGSGCSLNPPRGEDHFPFLSYTTITNNSARCANLLPGSYNEVISAFNAGTNFIWLTPNDCNNMHSCSVATGDAWIQSWVPSLLTAMAGKKAALIIMFDEAYTSPPYIYMSFSGPATKLADKPKASHTHYSLLKLIEDVGGGGNLGQGDVTDPSPLEFFNSLCPNFTLSAYPGSV